MTKKLQDIKIGTSPITISQIRPKFNIHVGDVVKLISGGSKMVAIDGKVPREGEPTFICAWHDKNGCPHTVEYEERFLTKVNQ